MAAPIINSLRPGSAPPARLFRRITYVATGCTLALMVIGGIVRVSDSGLGCGPARSGVKGWPLCGGRLIPGVDTHRIVEYTHRALVATVTVLLIALIVVAVLYFRDRPWLIRTGTGVLGLLLGQAVLGALTVEHGLSPALVAAHLGLAMLTLAGLLMLCRLARQAEEDQPPATARGPRAIRVLAAIALLAALATIVAGGYMAAGDLHGTTPAQANTEAIDAHMACGKQFPSCNDAFLPFGESKAVNIHLAHRSLVYLSCALIIALFALIMRRRSTLDSELRSSLTRWAVIVLGIFGVQVLLGALNVWLGEREWLIVAHLLVGTLLWSSLVLLSFNANGARLPERVAKRRDTRVEAVPA